MTSLHDNAPLYVVKRCYHAATGPYECHTKHWWIKTSRHRVFDPRHDCSLEVLNCGEAVFGRIHHDILAARNTIDIITWGFDPGMVLIRSGSAENGIRYGDLLKQAATRSHDPVIVRLLVWHDDVFAHLKMRNNPAYYGSRFPTIKAPAGYLETEHERYNASWFDEVLAGKIPNIRLHARKVPVRYRDSSLAGEVYASSPGGYVGSLYATHHQKMVLIDYESPQEAVGYVMGHNSVTDFWDTAAHTFRDPRRETLYRKNPKEITSQVDAALDDASHFFYDSLYPGRTDKPSRRQERMIKFMEEHAFTAKPYQDVSMRVRGPVLFDLNHNFCEGWSESRLASSMMRHSFSVVEAVLPVLATAYAAAKKMLDAPDLSAKEEQAVLKDPDEGFIGRRKQLAPAAFKLKHGPHSAQLLRTQPMHDEKGIKECYANLTRQMERYIFIQNQYIQYEEWATYLIECVQRLRKDGYTKPINVFILTSTPESDGMDLPTYAVAKKLGQSRTMVYEHNEAVALAKQGKAPMPISPQMLSKSGINVVMGSLWTCAPAPKSQDDYEEIYIHAKVAIVDDAAFTIGSANLNVRSMALDSELNVLSQAMDVAFQTRRELFFQCAGSHGPEQFGDMADSLKDWKQLAVDNLAAKEKIGPLTSRIVAFHVNRKPGPPVI
jgi:phosphatidylserine/phosphatidylglycerophosphate/cardiolipin synthase-like enzyme